MSNATDYDYWIIRSETRFFIGPQGPTAYGSPKRFATRNDARYYVDAQLAHPSWKVIHVVNRRKKAEAQRDELLTLARKLVELEEWVASTTTSDARGMTVDVSWTGELANIIAEAKLALERAQ